MTHWLILQAADITSVSKQSQSHKSNQRQVEETRFVICATKELGPPMGGFVTFSGSRPRIISPLWPTRLSYCFQDYSVNRHALCTPKVNHRQSKSRCSSLSTYWRSLPPPPTLSLRPLQDVMHRSSTDLRSTAPTPFHGRLPHALPSTRPLHRLHRSLSPAS